MQWLIEHWSDLCIMIAAGSIPALRVELGGRFRARVPILDKKTVFNRIASPRKVSDWLWHVIDAKVRAWIRFILSVHTPPKPSFHIKHKTRSHSRSSPPATTESLLFKRTRLRGQGLISILIAVYCTKGWSISLWSDMDKLNTLFF